MMPPLPGTKFRTPSGIPASLRREKASQPLTTERLDGLYRTALPVTSAADTIPTDMARGKFQGAMTSPTPLGR